MSKKQVLYRAVPLALALAFAPAIAHADGDSYACKGLPTQGALQLALSAAVATETSGLNNQMWATIVDRDGVVCAVAFSGVDRGAQWPGSRAISAQKANTANSFSLDASSSSGGSGQPNGLSLSTANLYSAVQPAAAYLGYRKVIPWIHLSLIGGHLQATERQAIRWWGTRSGASMSSAVGWLFMGPARNL